MKIPGEVGKVHGITPGATFSYTPVETALVMPLHFAISSNDNYDFAGNMHADGIGAFSAAPSLKEAYVAKNIAWEAVGHDRAAKVLSNADNFLSGTC